MADSTWPVNLPSPRDSNRSYRAEEMTGAGTPVSMAASTVQRPSPESDTRPVESDRSGDVAKAAAVTGQVTQRGADHRPPPPHFGHVSHVDVVLVGPRVPQGRGFRVDLVLVV